MLYGEQGFFKSSFFAILGGDWHADSPIDITNKDSFAQIHAAWIYEFAELENVVHGRAESRLKAWLTSTHDMYRAPYARSVGRKARCCVICGTTNRQQFLTDDTGSRRFWIVPVAGPIDRESLAAVRDQLWAEAVCAYEAGEEWWLSHESEQERERLNQEFQSEDPWQEPIEQALSARPIARVSVAEILRDILKIDTGRHDQWSQVRVARILNALGWKRRQFGQDRKWMYER
jgi:predicted P-loop ATPase